MYVVVIYNDNLRLSAVGTPTGRPFKVEKAAQRVADQIEAETNGLRALVVEIEEGPE